MFLWPSQNIRTLEKSWQSQILFSLETKFSARIIESIKFDDIFHGIGNKSTLQIQPLCICSILSPMQYKIIY